MDGTFFWEFGGELVFGHWLNFSACCFSNFNVLGFGFIFDLFFRRVWGWTSIWTKRGHSTCIGLGYPRFFLNCSPSLSTVSHPQNAPFMCKCISPAVSETWKLNKSRISFEFPWPFILTEDKWTKYIHFFFAICAQFPGMKIRFLKFDSQVKTEDFFRICLNSQNCFLDFQQVHCPFPQPCFRRFLCAVPSDGIGARGEGFPHGTR